MRSAFCSVVVCLLALAFGSPASAGDPLPYYDIRLTPDGKPASFVEQAKAGAIAPAAAALRDAAADQLRRNIPGVRIDAHEFFGTPHCVGATATLLAAPIAGAATGPRQAVREFIEAHQVLFAFEPGELDIARMEREFVTVHNGVTHLTFQQQFNGIDLYGCEVLANVTRRGELINVSSSMLRRPAGDFTPPAAVLSPLEAIRAAAANVGINMTADPSPLAAPEGVRQRQTWQNTPDFRSDEPITSELIYFPRTQVDIRPAWSVLIPEVGIGNTYEMMVDATNGQILRRWNRLHFATTEPIAFRVYTSDDPAPGTPGNSTPVSTQFPFVPRELVIVNPTDVPYSTINLNGWVDDGTNATDGNNVHAHLDLANANPTSTGAVSGSSYRVFDFPLEPLAPPYDITVAPSDDDARNSAVTQLFYLCNVYHDRLWQLGFNEEAKNFQVDNFGRGGTGNDRVQADCQDGGGTNNANFSTSGSDGSSARMQMYLFIGPNPDRDGSLDSNIVFHEFSHGLSVRLSNGTVSGQQSGGMGEGWSDYFAVALNAQPGDNPHAVYPMGPYATYQLGGLTSNYYFGIRRFPYSTDMNKNPATYADIDPNQLSFPPGVPISPVIGGAANEVHNVGEVWCNTLLECRANLWDNEGFSANNKMMQLVVDGLKLEATNPNFLQARDAILQADLADYGGVDQCLLWKAFAKRGMGPQATSPSGSTAFGVMESYNLLDFSFPDGPPPDQLQPGVTTSFHVNVSAIVAAVQPTDGTGVLYYSINGGTFTSVAMTSVGVNQYLAILPATDCFYTVRYYFSADSCAGATTDPVNAPVGAYSAITITSTNILVSYDFQANPGWTVSGAATDGQWDTDPGVPVNCARGDPPTDYDGSGQCWMTDNSRNPNNDCNSDVEDGTTTLTSQIIDISALTDPRVSYARWYSNTAGRYPQTQVFTVEVSSDGGGSWVNLETVGPATTSPNPEVSGGWFAKAYRIVDFIPITDQFRIRFNATDNIGAVVEAAIDAFSIEQDECVPPCPAANGDMNSDTLVDGADIQRFADALLGVPSGGEICAGDFNGNHGLDMGDIDGFAAALVGP